MRKTLSKQRYQAPKGISAHPLGCKLEYLILEIILSVHRFRIVHFTYILP